MTSPADQSKRRKVQREVAWVVAAQILSSLSNLLLAAAVVRYASLQEFGAFALTYVAYGITLGLTRAGGGELLLLRTAENPGRRKADGSAFLANALALATFAAAVLLAMSFVTSQEHASILRGFALVLPGAVLQDAVRYYLFSGGLTASVTVMDAIWIVAQVAGFGVALALDANPSPTTLVVIWGAGAAVSLAYGGVRAGAVIKPAGATAWLRADAARVRSFVVDFALLTGSAYASWFVVAGIAGVGAVGAMRAAWLLFYPVDRILAALRVLTLPALGRAASSGGQAVRRTAARLAPGFGVVTAVWGACLAIVPDRVGDALLGATWTDAAPLVGATALVYTARAVGTPGLDALRALGATRQIIRIAASVSILLLVGVAAGAAAEGALGAVYGTGGALTIGLLLWWGVLIRDTADSDGSHRPKPLAPSATSADSSAR